MAAVRRCVREGGPLEQWRTARGRRQMEHAAALLPPLPPTEGVEPVEVHLLTGQRYWYQTAFCVYSFARSANTPVIAHIYDDGTLGSSQVAALRRLGIDVRLYAHAELCARLDDCLPAGKFPFLRDRWIHFPIIRKIIAAHAFASSLGWKLILDSDMLFFREPSLLLNWLRHPTRPFYMCDVENSYGYTPGLLGRLSAAPIPDRLNAGMYGLHSGEIDWIELETKCGRLITEEGPHYYLEQALLALLLAGRQCVVAPAADYVTLPAPPEAADCRAVMHHYVAESKCWYFRQNWRRCLPLP